MHFDLIMFSPVVNVFVLAIAVLLLIILLINISISFFFFLGLFSGYECFIIGAIMSE